MAMQGPAYRQVLLLVVAAAAFAATGADARLTNPVTDWINATQAVVATHGIQNQLSAKYYGLVGLASHEALKKGGAPPAALVAYASHAILSEAFPWRQSALFDTLLKKQTANFTDAENKAAHDIAVPIANKLFKERVEDLSTEYPGFKPAPNGTAYKYQFVPDQKYALYPQLAKAKPFVLSTAEVEAIASNKDEKAGPVFKPAKNDYQSTYEYGAKDSKVRKQYDTDSAYFWADGANTSAIGGHWLDIAREVLPKDLSLEDTAKFYALAGAAAYDASITAWNVKYGPENHWRPITAFRSGYPGFKADPTWAPLLNTPAHPEYLSGHQATVGAILEIILRTLGGKDEVTFTIGSEGTPWLTRTYNKLTDAAVEVGESRRYAGVHFNSSNVDGLKLGRLVAGKVYEKYGGSEGTTAKAASSAAAGDKKGGRRLRHLLQLWW